MDGERPGTLIRGSFKYISYAVSGNFINYLLRGLMVGVRILITMIMISRLMMVFMIISLL